MNIVYAVSQAGASLDRATGFEKGKNERFCMHHARLGVAANNGFQIYLIGITA